MVLVRNVYSSLFIKLTHFGNSCVLIISSSKKEVTGDTAVFEDGAMGKTPDGSV